MNSTLSRQDVLEILEIIANSNFDEMHIETDGFKIGLVKASAVTTCPEPPAPSPRMASGTASIAASSPADDHNVVDVAAPLLGVFFRAPKPGAEPFVHPGSQIAADTIIGIIEVMKFMNPVPAGIAGEVIEIIAVDGHLVEFGQVLLRVRRINEHQAPIHRQPG
jgi:acetyl-CoA carboxylase biotin carboxyl carrier protein